MAEAAFNLSPVYSRAEINAALGSGDDKRFKAIWYFAASGFEAFLLGGLTRKLVRVYVDEQVIEVERSGVRGRTVFALDDVHDAWLFATAGAGYRQ